MMKKMLVVALFLIVGSVREASAEATVAQKCSNQFQKVAVCLSYATGKAETPTKECCESVKGIKDSEPECLCYVMQQANSGSDEIKKMGIQVAKLLQLPTACSLKNASASDCPSIPAGSPEAAIFNNTASTPTPSAPAGKSAPEKAGDSSGITKPGPHHAGLMATAVAIIFFTIPVVGSISNLFV
ncbi:PREDICTED: non-specific [Prunus dulcis]|uniref:PREDICTED: non-specific n=1 Tax=Prunus dulcis TaxID=3755 RepID=A0A5E4F2G6_PRUDU|nr:PREDICTED: non-specific [Prunus dulcis]